MVAEKTEIKGGRSTLDIAAGSSVTARKLGRLAGGEGNVCGLDVSLKVLQDTVKRTRKEGLTNIMYVQGTRKNYPLRTNLLTRSLGRLLSMLFQIQRSR